MLCVLGQGLGGQLCGGNPGLTAVQTLQLAASKGLLDPALRSQGSVGGARTSHTRLLLGNWVNGEA